MLHISTAPETLYNIVWVWPIIKFDLSEQDPFYIKFDPLNQSSTLDPNFGWKLNSLSFSFSSRRWKSSLAWCLSMLPWTEIFLSFCKWNHLVLESMIALWTLERHVVTVNNFLMRPQGVFGLELLVANLTIQGSIPIWHQKSRFLELSTEYCK